MTRIDENSAAATEGLFPGLGPVDAGEASAAGRAEGPFAVVALERAIDKVLDYSIPERFQAVLQPGQRVRVPLGRRHRPVYGYVVAIKPNSDYPKIKPIAAIDDPRALLTPPLMELARWIAGYYITPLGTVIESMIPSAVKKKIGVGYTTRVRMAQSPEQIQDLLEKTHAPKRRAILARLLLVGPERAIDLLKLASESGATPATVRKLAGLGLIEIRQEVDLPAWDGGIAEMAEQEMPIELNDDQRRADDELRPRVAAGGFSVSLLHGITGSGKTELYLRAIAAAVEAGRQAIVLVPEIALTPQTARRFMARFKRVAILHSGLSASQRHKYWQRLAQGHADVVVGARSAVFAPVPRLGVIVVDEEHESSYKQDSAPRYHGRDVAIKRGQIEGAPVILGSATPSLETWWRVTRPTAGTNPAPPAPSDPTAPIAPKSAPMAMPFAAAPSPLPNYHLLTLPRRVRGLALPEVELVDLRQERRLRRGIHLISMRLERLIGQTIAAGRQAIILINRRGYSNYVYCPSCTQVIQCKYCDATMTYHRSADSHAHGGSLEQGLHSGQLHCHYCLAVNPLPSQCPQCGKKLSLFGLGTQRVEEELIQKFPGLKFARVDSDSMRSGRDYETLLARFGRGEVQVLLGTQMIAKGLDYPNVTLVGIISGDTALSLPDFRAAERTFQLITQVAGRAGRGDVPGRVVLQTFQPDDPTIQAAIRQDYLSFARTELGHRREVRLPPLTRMVRIILRDHESDRLHDRSERLAAELAGAVADAGGKLDAVQLRGPMPCPISRIAGYYRDQIVLIAPTARPLQNLLAIVRKSSELTKAERVAVDVDPVSLL